MTRRSRSLFALAAPCVLAAGLLFPAAARADIIQITSGSFVGNNMGGGEATFSGAGGSFHIQLGFGNAQTACLPPCLPGDSVPSSKLWSGWDVYGTAPDVSGFFSLTGPAFVLPPQPVEM